MLSESQIIDGCRKYNRRAQKELYLKYAPLLRGISIRYSRNYSEAEDILQDGFLKIFSNIKQYSGKGSFEGWMKRIVINTAINHYNQSIRDSHYDIDEIKETDIDNDETDNNEDIRGAVTNTEFTREDILNVVNELPDGYRMVFNLYVMEDLTHKKIAEMLDISESTSKSQLSRARKIIQKKLFDLSKNKSRSPVLFLITFIKKIIG